MLLIASAALTAYGVAAFAWFTQTPLTKQEIFAHAAVFLPIIAGPCLLLVQVARCKSPTWQSGVLTLLGGLTFLGWLAYDEPPPETLELPLALTQHPADSERSYALLLALPDAVVAAGEPFKKLQLPNGGWGDPINALSWTDWVKTNAAEIEAVWADAKLLREWLKLAAAEPTIADLNSPLERAPYLEFLPQISNLVAARAYLFAHSGNDVEAAALLSHLNEIGVKLERHGQSMLRRLIGTNLQDHAIGTTRVLLDENRLSPGARDTLRIGLAPALPPSEGAYQLILCEYAFARIALVQSLPVGIGDSTSRWRRFLRNPRLSLLVNVNHTLRLYQDNISHAASLAKNRDLDQKPWKPSTKPSFRKNLLGTLMLNLGGSSHLPIASSYWLMHDERQALLERL